MAQEAVFSGKFYRNFIEAIHSPFTRSIYRNALFNYMRFKKVESCDLLLKEDPRVIEEQLIDYVIYNREELKIASNSINSKIAPIRKFYECNDIELRWKKIKSYVGRNKGKGGTGRKKDRPYIHEEIQKMLEKSDQRDRVTILLMSSAGIRVGALPSLKIRNLEKIEEYQLYKITVYEGEDEEYITFCTPECAKEIDSYLEYRKRHGENSLKDDAPLIREEFDIDDEIKATHPREPTHTLLKGGKLPALLSDSQRSIEADLKDYDQTFPIVDAVRKELSLDFWNFNYSAFFVVIAPLGLKKPEISFKNSEIKVKIGSSTNIDPGDIRIRGFGKTGNDNTNLRVAENNFRRDDSNLVYRKAVVVTQEDGAIVDLYYKEDRFENYYVKRIED